MYVISMLLLTFSALTAVALLIMFTDEVDRQNVDWNVWMWRGYTAARIKHIYENKPEFVEHLRKEGELPRVYSEEYMDPDLVHEREAMAEGRALHTTVFGE